MTDLDRLLELYANFPWTNSQCDEAKHLKSQLESKLAEWDKIKDDVYHYLKIREMLDEKTVKLCKLESQHTNLVKAIQDRIQKAQDYLVMPTSTYHQGKANAEWLIGELQNLLKESEKE